MLQHTHVDGTDNRFTIIAGPLVGNYLEKWLEVIIRETYQEEYEDRSWSYEPMSHLWPAVEPDSDSRDDGSRDKIKNISITLMDRNRGKWYWLHTGTQEGSERVTK